MTGSSPGRDFAQSGDGGIRFHVSPSISTGVVTINVDGHSVDLRWFGVQDIRVRPSVHFVQVYSAWAWRFGEADLLIDVRPGEMIDLYYSPPHHAFARGALGLVPQRGKGLGLALGAMALFLVGVVYSTFADAWPLD